MSDAANVAKEVHALEGLDLHGLREAWRSRFGPPPALRSPYLLRLALAWRMQAEAHGGLDRNTKDKLRKAEAPKQSEPGLSLGMRLVREWQGVRHEVTVVAGGFLHNGKIHKSLSMIARAITGSRWNGPRFFGLRERAP